MSFYQQKDQKILMFPESAFMTPLDGTKVTANPANYPHYSRLNVIPDGIDWNMPIRKKEKVWDIGAGKHPTHIFNTEFEPSEITLEMMHQDARFLALAGGTCTSAGTQAEVWVLTAGSWAEINIDGAYFLMYAIDATGHVICYAVYSDVDSDQGGDPNITGATSVNVDWASGDNLTGVDVTTVATYLDELELTLEALATVTAVTTTATTATMTTFANNGAIPPLRNGATSCGHSFAYTTYGASTHTFTEQLDNTMKSFGLHIEYDNGSEDIVADLFGCVITSYELTIDYEEKIVKESVTLMCPYFIVGNISTNPPLRRSGMDAGVWGDLKESASNYVIMSGTTDRTPATLNKLTLTIENELDLFPEIGYNYRQTVICGKRNVTMNLVGFVQTNDLWTSWKNTWDDTNGYYTGEARLNSEIKLEREATYDNWQLSVYNWIIEEFGLRLFSIDDKIMGIDVTFNGASPDSSGYLLDSLVIKDYMEKLVYGVANS